jgi:ribonuclease P protein component
VLPSASRLRRSADFAATVRRGARVRRGRLVVHHRAAAGDAPAAVGFVVSRAVGGSVVRHRVTRRLRAAARAHLAQLPAGSTTVVRALPDAASAGYAQLDGDLAAALQALTRDPR